MFSAVHLVLVWWWGKMTRLPRQLSEGTLPMHLPGAEGRCGRGEQAHGGRAGGHGSMRQGGVWGEPAARRKFGAAGGRADVARTPLFKLKLTTQCRGQRTARITLFA